MRPPLAGSCCLKNVVPLSNGNPTCTSGMNRPATFQVFGDTTQSSLNRSDGHAATNRTGFLNTNSTLVNLVCFVCFVCSMVVHGCPYLTL